MHVILVLSGLLDLSSLAVASSGTELARVLAGAPLEIEKDGLLGCLAPYYGLAKQRDWPLAAVRLAAWGPEPAGDYWLRATPITLVVGRDDVRVAGAVTDLTAAEADALLEPLRRHFADDGLSFEAPRPTQWFVRSEREPRLVTRPLRTVIGRPLRRELATGEDAPVWRRWEQEIQMLLHEHPVNAAREARAAAPVSGVWFDQGGRLPTDVPAVSVATWSGDESVAALAHFARGPLHAVLPPLGTILAGDGPGIRIVMPADVADLAAIDRDYAAPAREALARGRIAVLTVLADGVGMPAAQWRATRPRAWRRWWPAKPSPPLATLLAATRHVVETA